jgi:hypothetical protein
VAIVPPGAHILGLRKGPAMPSSHLLFALILTGSLINLPALGQTTETKQSCVDVKIGMEQYYSCLNQRLQSGIEQHRFTSRDAPYSATSAAPAVGGFNEAATRERLGNAFGHSVIPQRPPPPNFSSPLVPR